LLLFKENTVFKVRFYDQGLGTSKEEIYEVNKSEIIEGKDCWVLEYPYPKT